MSAAGLGHCNIDRPERKWTVWCEWMVIVTVDDEEAAELRCPATLLAKLRNQRAMWRSVVTAKFLHFRGEGFCAPVRRERGADPFRQVGISSEERGGRAKEPPPKGLR